jgi:hypothetical protein
MAMLNASRRLWRMQGRPAVADDIVTRLQQMLDGPVPFVIGREDIRNALNEIERLQKEINDLRLQVVTLSIPKENHRG